MRKMINKNKDILSKQLLNIFIPTYRRSNKLNRCISSLCKEIDEMNDSFNITVHISNNDKNDLSVKKLISSFNKDYLIYHENNHNIGIDRNHEKVYEYCDSDYVLCLADDDMILPGCLKYLLSIIQKEDDVLFYILNSYLIDNKTNKNAVYKINKEILYLNTIQSIRHFVFDKPKALLPLLPYYGGIVINMKMIREKYSRKDCYIGTFHYYIAILWDALLTLKDNKKIAIISKPTIFIGMDNDKTWFSYSNEVYNNLNNVYKYLPFSTSMRKDIMLVNKLNNFAGGGIIKRVLLIAIKIKSYFWKIDY